MNKTLAIAAKEFRHMTQDRFTLVLTLLVPALQLILYGYALEIRFRNLPAAILNFDEGAAGRSLERRIAGSPLLAIDQSRRTEDAAVAALRQGAIRAAIEIPAGFTDALLTQREIPLRVWVDGSDVATSNYLLAALDALGRQATIERVPRTPEVSIEPSVLFNPMGRTASFLLPGLIGILVQMITTLLMALSIAGERERGTLEQLLVTRMRPPHIIAGKALAVGAVGLAEAASLVLVMRWLFQVPIAGSVLLLGAMLPLLVLAPLGIGLLIAAFARTQSQALQLTQAVFLPSVLLSGFLMPKEFLHAPLGWLSELLPTTYLVTLVRGLVLRGATAEDLAPAIVIVLAFSAGLGLAGYVGLRRSLVE